ncbi:hypothetical protein J4573_15860 [Actinomadura barringtoniae]|uniref:Uncharacterized protein n=1 Tax=Actinomadura barringtoniae TaxID=1427535 RepID=A0A939PG49_9ACTN|nr:hypothetical protein [Actinomadura barringtoniae]MBO2448579.1 hypothetical protein [Actinomadura barringtoniae]
MIEAEPAVHTLDSDVEYRLRIIRDDASHDDRAVALGLLATGIAGTPAETPALLDQKAVETVLDQAGEWRSALYDLWYRLRIPFGDAPLDSWYVLALAFGKTGGDVPKAVELHAGVLQRMAAAEDPIAVLRTEFGLTGETREGGEDAFADAVLARAPFRSALPRPWHAGLRERALAPWTDLREEERPVLLLELKQRIQGLEQVRFFVRGEVLENKQVAARLHDCARTAPEEWDEATLAVATLAWMWRESGFCLQELNQSILSLPLVIDFMVRRIRDYAASAGVAAAEPPESPIELARQLGRLRVRIERDHLRCLQFDGSNWERREFLVPRSACSAILDLPGDLREQLQDRFDAALPGEGPPVWAAAMDAATAAGATPTDVIKELARWAAADTALPVDYAIFTTPIGVKLDAPWELEYEDVFCYTAFHEGFDRDAEGVPFDHVGIQNAIGQRLRYNVVKKAQNYTLLRRFKAQSFNLPDIAVAEDANHGGHRAAGIRLSCRIPTYIHHDGLTWKGLADVRLNRTIYREHLEFRPSDVPLASRLATWLGWIADAAYARGLEFDRVYGKKLTRPGEEK